MGSINSVINVNVPTEVKEESNIIFNNLGLNMSTAINMFLKKVIIEKGIPFEVNEKPSRELKEALKELVYMEKHPEKYKTYHNVDEIFEDIISEE